MQQGKQRQTNCTKSNRPADAVHKKMRRHVQPSLVEMKKMQFQAEEPAKTSY